MKDEDMDTIYKSDGSLDKEKISRLDQAQTNALIEKLHLDWCQLKVKNSIFQGKESAYKSIVERHVQVDLDLYDMTEKCRALEKRCKSLKEENKSLYNRLQEEFRANDEEAEEEKQREEKKNKQDAWYCED